MRSVLFVFLVGCGGGSKSAPPPISNQPPVTEPSKPMVVEITRPTCTEANMKCAMATFEYFSKQMCACKDKACADHTNEEMTTWGTEMAKSAGAAKDEKPDPEMAKRAADLMTSYTECMTKLMMNAVPPPDPCAGGADPCGG